MPLLLEWGEELDTIFWMCSKKNYIFDVVIIIILINNASVVLLV